MFLGFFCVVTNLVLFCVLHIEWSYEFNYIKWIVLETCSLSLYWKYLSYVRTFWIMTKYCQCVAILVLCLLFCFCFVKADYIINIYDCIDFIQLLSYTHIDIIGGNKYILPLDYILVWRWCNDAHPQVYSVMRYCMCVFLYYFFSCANFGIECIHVA